MSRLSMGLAFSPDAGAIQISRTAVDWTGRTLGGFSFLAPTIRRTCGSLVIWRVRCEVCGHEQDAAPSAIREGSARCEQCHPPAPARRSDWTGEVIGDFKLIDRTSRRSGGSVVWVARCIHCRARREMRPRDAKRNPPVCGCRKERNG